MEQLYRRLISGHIGTAKIGNFKELAVTRPTDHGLRERLQQAIPDEPDVKGFIFGEEAIASAARYNPRYFATTIMGEVCSRTVVSTVAGVLSEHTPHGHFLTVANVPGTRPTSASAWGDNRRAATIEKRRAAVPGWHKQPEMTIVGSSIDAAGEGPAFRLYGSDRQ